VLCAVLCAIGVAMEAAHDAQGAAAAVVLAQKMAAAISAEGGAVGRYDVARRLYLDRERALLGRVARGSARAFADLDALRKGPLYFPPTRFEGAVDYSARGAPSRWLGPDGDFRLGLGNRGGDLADVHPAALYGAVPRVVMAREAPAAPEPAPTPTPAPRSRGRGGDGPREERHAPLAGSGSVATSRRQRRRRSTSSTAPAATATEDRGPMVVSSHRRRSILAADVTARPWSASSSSSSLRAPHRVAAAAAVAVARDCVTEPQQSSRSLAGPGSAPEEEQLPGHRAVAGRSRGVRGPGGAGAGGGGLGVEARATRAQQQQQQQQQQQKADDDVRLAPRDMMAGAAPPPPLPPPPPPPSVAVSAVELLLRGGGGGGGHTPPRRRRQRWRPAPLGSINSSSRATSPLSTASTTTRARAGAVAASYGARGRGGSGGGGGDSSSIISGGGVPSGKAKVAAAGLGATLRLQRLDARRSAHRAQGCRRRERLEQRGSTRSVHELGGTVQSRRRDPEMVFII
jgi:hypothetical protein